MGLGEPILEGRALTVAQAVKELEPYLIGKDPIRVVHHWQSMYKHAFYRGGPILTSALSGVEHALWDLTGKALGVPVYKLLGGALRDKLRVYARCGGQTDQEAADLVRARVAQGFRALKTGVMGGRVQAQPATGPPLTRIFCCAILLSWPPCGGILPYGLLYQPHSTERQRFQPQNQAGVAHFGRASAFQPLTALPRLFGLFPLSGILLFSPPGDTERQRAT